ncbi:hypothetical protein [Flavobacterium caseinilyticum]|uniref:Uncharacterized protein n=1 Tax=Flavobacterium caseinilyticum TaxID=2541732 RepID=A0A4R5B074_9FLAO|nr:hypothetical protein [Flavobacterium caseinilyticum]TDD76914.1 hypothetical protein E0F89_04740 [Flavobacterium caseinilyticum]
MKSTLVSLLILFSIASFGQKTCDYSVNVTDSIGSYKSTAAYMISEKNFGGNSNYIFYSLALTDGMPTLTVQLIQKSKEFIKANCFDKNSKIYLQLNNGKIITLIHIDQENCGTTIRDDAGFDNRVNSGIFMFMKDSFKDLKNSPVSMMQIKYSTGTEDYVLKKEFKSELDNKIYNPETYFINTIKCIE